MGRVDFLSYPFIIAYPFIREVRVSIFAKVLDFTQNLKPTNFVLHSQKLHNPWTGDTSFTWRNRSKSDVYAAPTAGGFPYSSTLSREAEKVSLQENLRKEKRGLDNLHLLWMHSDMFCLSFFELLFESMSGLSLGKVKGERFIKNPAEKWFYCSMHL